MYFININKVQPGSQLSQAIPGPTADTTRPQPPIPSLITPWVPSLTPEFGTASVSIYLSPNFNHSLNRHPSVTLARKPSHSVGGREWWEVYSNKQNKTMHCTNE